MSPHARPLAEWLAAQSDESLGSLFARREVKPDAPWQNFFDAAEELLDAGSIQRVLPTLTRAQAATLIGAEQDAEASAALHALALTDAQGHPLPPVAEAIAGRTVPEGARAHAAQPAGETAAAHAAEHAFTSVAALAEVLLVTRDTPLALLTDGRVNAAERRRLVEAGAISPDAPLDQLVALAHTAGLVHPTDRRLMVTPRGARWLVCSAIERWSQLASAWRDTLTRLGLADSNGWRGLDAWSTEHPWDADWPTTASHLRALGELLGLIAEDGTEPAWTTPLRTDGTPGAAELQALLPAEVDRIFLQNDLTAIAPGPLAPHLDVRLRNIARRESAAQASAYRFTADSLAHAFATGESEASILEFLEQLSLTGIPQPLRYLIAQTAQRHGTIRIRIDPPTGRTRIEADDPHTLAALAVDQSLRPLGLLRAGDAITTKVSPGTAYWALSDAKYPVMLIDLDGAPVAVRREQIAESTGDSAETSYTTLIVTLRAGEGPDAEAAWLERALDAAVQSRTMLIVEVEMPDGTTRELTLEATGLGGGRLRGRDRAADVERTLPISSIRSARFTE